MPAGEGLPADRVEIMRQSILITAASSGIGKALSFELAHRGYSLALAVRRTIETNLIGAMATVDAAMAYFLQQGKGHIVGTCSVAAFRGLPRNASYSASKAGFAVYLEAVGRKCSAKISTSPFYIPALSTPL